MPFESIRKTAEADFPTRWGHFRIFGFVGTRSVETSPTGSEMAPAQIGQPEEMIALVMGDVSSAPPIVRVHSQCLTGDVFGSLRCDCRLQLEMALRAISEAGAGILLYELQEGRGIGLMPKLQAYALQDNGLDTVEANEQLGFKPDHRVFELPAEVLKLMGITQVRLMTNNPDKVAAMEMAGVRVVDRLSAVVESQESFEKYLQVKRDKMGHLSDETEVKPVKS
ncbi:MAG: GTP cyclohydrolase II [Acidobacteriaceae bacterium]